RAAATGASAGREAAPGGPADARAGEGDLEGVGEEAGLPLDLADPPADAPGDAPSERPIAVIRWRSVAPWTIAVALEDYRFRDPQRLPGEILGAVVGLDLVDAWAHAWQEPPDAVFTPIVEHQRDPRSRALPCEATLEVPAPRVRAIVQ